MRRAGSRSDLARLLGETYVQQCGSFQFQGGILAVEILRQAILHQRRASTEEGNSVASNRGAHADTMLWDGDPLKDIEFIAASGRTLRSIMRAASLSEKTWDSTRVGSRLVNAMRDAAAKIRLAMRLVAGF